MIDKNAAQRRRALSAAARADAPARHPRCRRDRRHLRPAGSHAMTIVDHLCSSSRRRDLPADPALLQRRPDRAGAGGQFGAIVGEPKTEPGLYIKVPLIQDIVRIDRRLSTTKPRVRDHRRRPEAAGGRRLCPLQDHQRSAVLPARAGGEPALRAVSMRRSTRRPRRAGLGARCMRSCRSSAPANGRHHAPA